MDLVVFALDESEDRHAPIVEVCSRSGCRARLLRRGANFSSSIAGTPARVPRSRRTPRRRDRQTSRCRRRRSAGSPQLGPARRHDHPSGRRHLHRQLHPAGEERHRLDLRSELRALEPAGGRHPRGPGAGEPHAEDREPQHRAGDQHRGRRPPLPVRRSRDHDDVGVHERAPTTAWSCWRRPSGNTSLAQVADRSGLRSLLHPRHPHRQRPAGDADEQRPDGRGGLVPVRSARGRRRQPGDRCLERSGPVQDRQQLPGGRGRERPVRRRRSGHREPGARPTSRSARTICSSRSRGRPAARATPASTGRSRTCSS